MVVIRVRTKCWSGVIFILKMTARWIHIFFVCKKFSVTFMRTADLGLNLLKVAEVAKAVGIRLRLMSFRVYRGLANALW